jgi:lipoprotein-anchoring transpeptidase ErfK/SrfK
MRAPRILTTLALALAALGIAAPLAAAQAPRPGELIAPGIAAAGVDLSNTTPKVAQDRLDALLGAKLQRDVIVKVAGRTFRLKAADAKLTFDAARTARRALYAGRRHAPGSPVQDVGLVLSHARIPVRSFAAKVAAGSRRAPRDATVHITVRHIEAVHSRRGAEVDAAALAGAIDAALAAPRASRVLRPARASIRPKVTVADLPSRYATILTVDRTAFKLRLFKRLKLSKTYPIAIGAAGFDTPSGVFTIANKQVDPAWHVPNSAWAGSLAGTTVPGGAPDNPLKARWLGIYDGVGIHGTSESWSIGSRASHGCIRMHVPDVIDLYPRVPVGSKVLID